MRRSQPTRLGVAAVELAVLLPLLTFLFVITVDWGRIFYYSVTVTNAARQGAVYLQDPVAQGQSPYQNVTAAALADCTNLKPDPTVTSSSGTDSMGNPYVEVSVAWQMPLVTSYPGITNPVSLNRTVRMRKSVVTPP